jgi:hypothetical protein
VFLADAFTRVVTSCLSASPSTFAPLVANVVLPGTLPAITITGFFSLVWPATAPPGGYTFFFVLTVPQAGADGRWFPGEILAIAQGTLAVSP